jgi:hypothetical protein
VFQLELYHRDENNTWLEAPTHDDLKRQLRGERQRKEWLLVEELLVVRT